MSKPSNNDSKDDSDGFSKKKKVGNYFLGKIIGQGSFSKVRQGLHIIAREKVAVKIVPKKAALLREYVKRSVRCEAMLLQKLDHPNIIRMYEVMETENSYYLVLEHAQGGEFIKYLSEKSRLDESEARKFLRQMASAVDHMHASNITHRDLTLENLLLDKDMNIKIIDFGLSNVFYGDSSLNTQCGSPVYAAPEMFCNRKYGPAVDIWSMGVCFYAMLTGKLPFTADPPNNISLLHTIILRGPQLPGHITNNCANLLARMLAVDVIHRISMDDLLTHDWIMEDHVTKPVTRQPPVAKLYHTVPKAQVVSYMTTVFNFMEEDIYDSVGHRKMNAVAATYHLLLRRFDEGIHLVGYSVSVKEAPPGVSSKSEPEKVELPRVGIVSNEDTEQTGTGQLDPKSKLKSYSQMLKDCKLKSATSERLGSSSVLRQKEITLRRYKTRADVLKGNRAKEEFGFLPDFVLTYSQNNPSIPVTSHHKGADRFEWEQTFVITKKETCSNESNDTINKRPILNRQSTSQTPNELTTYQAIDGRVTRNADSVLPVPPSSPITPSLLMQDFKPVSRQLPKTPTERLAMGTNESTNNPNQTISQNTGSKQGHPDQACSPDPLTMFKKQKMQLARFASTINGKALIAQSQCGRKKTLTNREARSYFQEIEQAKVIGRGRKLLERSKSSTTAKSSEDFHTLYGRQVRTAGTHRDLPDIRISSHSAHRSTSDSRHFRQVDTSGILHFADLNRTSLPLYDARPVSPPKYTVEDGVMDVIKVHITSSSKY